MDPMEFNDYYETSQMLELLALPTLPSQDQQEYNVESLVDLINQPLLTEATRCNTFDEIKRSITDEHKR